MRLTSDRQHKPCTIEVLNCVSIKEENEYIYYLSSNTLEVNYRFGGGRDHGLVVVLLLGVVVVIDCQCIRGQIIDVFVFFLY